MHNNKTPHTVQNLVHFKLTVFIFLLESAADADDVGQII